MIDPHTDDVISTQPPPTIAELEAHPEAKRSWVNWIGIAISFAILIAALWELRRLPVATLVGSLPHSIAFWLVYPFYYLSLPISEYFIFKRLWHIPPRAIFPLLRKQVSNELLLGYSGEVYFYSWARENVAMTGSPFGAVKDVSILSAAVGNLATILLLLVSIPLLHSLLPGLKLGVDSTTLIASLTFILGSSLAIMFWRGRLFSLGAPEIKYIAWVHGLRLLISAGLQALLWHLALPSVALIWWLLFSAWWQLIARLPFVPNKPVVFAAVTVLAVGAQQSIAPMMAMLAALVFASHVLVAILLAVEHLAPSGKDPQTMDKAADASR